MAIPFAWLAFLSPLVMWPNKFWALKNGTITALSTIIKNLKTEFALAIGGWSHASLTFLPVTLLLFLATNNFMGLFPYIFTAPRHLSFTLAIALPLWIGHIVKAWVKIPQRILAHLVPLGTPPALMPFIVLIEITRNVIRPLTLSVRLAANIIAGHLLLTLLSQGAPSTSYALLALILRAVILLATLESAVALIQAYVFRVLSTLYLQEVNSPSLNN